MTKVQNCSNVGMGQIKLMESDESARTVLGSCVGLLLYSRISKRSAFAHIVLAEDKTSSGPVGKYADTALPEMLKQLAQVGVDASTLIAKIVGGSKMFGNAGLMEIGKSNCETIQAMLKEQKIRIAADDIGGNVGRKVTVDGSTGKITIEKAGQPNIEI